MQDQMKAIGCVVGMLIGVAMWAQPAHPEEYRLLWEITSPRQGQPSYLFGTMHVTDSRVFDMPDSVLIAIQNTAGFALEVDFDAASYRLLEYLYAQHGEGIFDESTWSSNASAWDGPRERPDPGELFKLLERSGTQAQEVTFLDAFLYRLAREQGKVITGLESIVDQMEVLTDQQGYDAGGGEGNPPASRRLRLQEMIEVYEKGDLDALDRMVNRGGTSQFFKDQVIVRRNHGMARLADSLMQVRPTFIGVGAAHLPGEEGVINLLRKAGYRLRPVEATYTGMNRTVRDKPYQARWNTFRREGDGYQLKVPTRPFGMNVVEGQVKMYLGMDFPGGVLYCFYAMNIPAEIPASRKEELSKSMIKSFGSHNIDAKFTKDILHGALLGKEYVVKKQGEHLRIRILFGKEKLYMLLLGNSKEVLFSDMANEWFNSLETFEPIRMTRQTRHHVHDPLNGFELEFPGEPDYEFLNRESFTTGGEETTYSIYEIKDNVHRQRLVMLTEDFEDWYSIGKLWERMPDCIRYYASGDLEPVGDYKPVVTDGVQGLEAMYLGNTGLRYRIRCYTRLNRLYLLGMTLTADDADSAVVDTVFASLRFLSTQQPTLAHPLQDFPLVEARLPGKPYRIEWPSLPVDLAGDLDSLTLHFHHSRGSSLNTSVSGGHIWKYYSGSDAELLGDAARAALRDSGIVQVDVPLQGGPWTGHHLVLQSYDSTQLDHRKWWVVGDYLIEARIQTTSDAPGNATAQQFFHHVRPGAVALASARQRDAHLGPKLMLILSEAEADDSAAAYGAAFALSRYKLRPEEYALAFDGLRAKADTLPFTLDDQLLGMILKQDDSLLLGPLKEWYADLPGESPSRIQVVEALLLREWEGARAWALERLTETPSPLDRAGAGFSWMDYLRDDTSFQHLQTIAFLLDHPRDGLQLAADMAQLATQEGMDYSGYAGKLASILEREMDTWFTSADARDWHREFQMQALLEYVIRDQLGPWPQLARKALRLPESYLPGSVFAAVAEKGIRLTKKEITHVFGTRQSRDIALSWMLDSGLLGKLPPRYRKQEYIAQVVLDIALAEYPDHVELVEKRKVTYLGAPQWLYVYKVANEGDTDWILAFSGPFPLKGDPQGSYFPLAGSNWEVYHPNSYEKKTKAWVKQVESYGE